MTTDHVMQVFTINVSKSVMKGVNRLVDLGYYASRSEFVRVAINRLLDEMVEVERKVTAVSTSEVDSGKIQVGDKTYNIRVIG